MIMTSRDIAHFLGLIGAKSVIIDTKRGWVRSSCPLSPWTHESGMDRHPSFGIKIPATYADVPYYMCFTCGRSGPLPSLLSALSLFSHERYAEASAFISQFELFKDNGSIGDIPKHKRVYMPDRFADVSLAPRPLFKNLPVPEEVLAQFPPLWEKSDLTAHREALRWLTEERHISFQPVGKYKLRLYTNTLDDIGVVFPILAHDGETVLDMWVRLIDRKKFFRLTPDSVGSPVEYRASNLLFGNHLQAKEVEDKPVVLVEGPLDALRLSSLGVQRVMATMGAMTSDQFDSFYAGAVYLGFDSDEAGQTFTKKALHELNVPAISILNWGVVGKKDAGDLENKTQFIQVFNQRTKILRTAKSKTRQVAPEDKRPPRSFLNKNGTFL